ncbi:MAG: hypothetical protein QOJ09_2247 [Actinomycetota bacterium]|jgi:hypothetical protein|nr:hypothetical protein [Actinomycetota bacterium]
MAATSALADGSNGVARRTALLVGVGSGVATAAAYVPGMGRAFGWDASVTVRLFIRAPLRDAVFSQYAANNHPYFSFLEQLVSRGLGTSSEAALRLLPIGLGALTVGIMATVLGERMGVIPALCGAAVLASNPLFLTLARDVRGYSLVTLCAVASTLAVVERREDGGWRRWLYIAAVGVGVGTHLFMVWVVVAHIVIVFVRRQARAEWTFRWVAAAMIGVVPYADGLSGILHRAGNGQRSASFPALVARDVLGTPLLRTFVIAGLVVIAIWLWRRHRLVVPIVVVAAAAVGGAWFAPAAGASRFFVWATPGTALLVAAAVRWRLWLVAPVAVAVAASCVSVADGYTADGLSNRAAAPYVEMARRQHKQACGLGDSTETLPVYTGDIPELFDPNELTTCDVVVVVDPHLSARLLAQVRPAFPFARRLPARMPGLLLYRDPALVQAVPRS